mgnify:CR=1 FL=1
MATVKIKIGETQYNMAQASAVKQKKLMTLAASKILMNSVAGGVKEIDISFLKGSLISMDENTLSQIEEIILEKCVKNGEQNAVTIDDFQNKMNEYFTLLAEGVAGNLSDFFGWLDSLQSKTNPTK